MLMWPARPSIFIANQLFAVMAQAGKADFVIDGYPEYGTDSTNLDSIQKNILRHAAQIIVQSQSTMTPIRAALVIGHADKALRKAPSERVAFELEISQRRASSACEALLKEVNRLAQGAHFAKTLQRGTLGVGNRNPLISNASTEAQMRKNRRVEILFARHLLSMPRCGV